MRIFLFFLLLVVGCGGVNKDRKEFNKRNLASSASTAIMNSKSREAVDKISTKKLVLEIKKNTTYLNSIFFRSQVSLENESSKSQFNVSIKIKDDEKILLSGSLIIPLFKALLTKESISFYEKISKTYFEGDYDYLSSRLKNKLSFQNIQNILIGRPIIKLNDLRLKQGSDKNNYMLYTDIKRGDVRIEYFFNPTNFKLLSQYIINKGNRLEITYNNYSLVEGQLFPKDINVILKTKKSNTKIDISLKTVEFGSKLSFPFKIPEGYKPID